MTSIRITVKVPEIVLNSSFVRFQIKQKMRTKTGPDLEKEFEKTVEGFQGDAPIFMYKILESGTSIVTRVGPSGSGTAKYTRLNNGSPPHIITPRHRGILRFQVGYRPATRPRVIGSQAKHRYGDFVQSISLRHPGFEAREFDETIAVEYEDTFREDMQDAIKIATARKG